MKTLAIASLFAVAGTAQAQWAEIGDAGNVADSAAQTVVGAGALTSISGNTSAAAGDEVDAYRIRITSDTAFSATTDGGLANFDTRLFLFDGAGNLILGNDDSVAGATDFSFSSFLSAPSTFTASTGGVVAASAAGVVLSPGEYILAVTGFSNEAYNAAQVATIDMASDFDALHGVSGGPFSNWENNGFGASGSYTVALTGAEFIPAPGTAALLGLGGLAAARRRR